MAIDSITTKMFWRAVFIEFLGTTLFVMLVTALLTNDPPDIVRISFAIGLAIAVLAHVFGPISGGHFNPAIALGTIITGDVGIARGAAYFIAQLFGGIAGSAITFGLNPHDTRSKIDGLRLGAGLNVAQGFFVEFFLTAVLVFAFLASSSSDNNRKDFGFANPLAVGLSITLSHLVGIPYTGSGINPARAFGPSVIVNTWMGYHWVYWVAPLLGGVFAALFYRFIVKMEIGIEDERTPLLDP